MACAVLSGLAFRLVASDHAGSHCWYRTTTSGICRAVRSWCAVISGRLAARTLKSRSRSAPVAVAAVASKRSTVPASVPSSIVTCGSGGQVVVPGRVRGRGHGRGPQDDAARPVAEVSQRRGARLSGFGAGGGQEDKLGVFEPGVCDLAVTGAEFLDDRAVECLDFGGGHRLLPGASGVLDGLRALTLPGGLAGVRPVIARGRAAGVPVAADMIECMSFQQQVQVPARYARVNVWVISRDTDAEVRFLTAAFGAVETPGSRMLGAAGDIDHVEVELGDSVIMLFDAKPGWPPTPAHLRIYVSDVAKAVEQATAAGARVVTHPTMLAFGERVARVRDPQGHLWWVHERVEDVAPEELATRFADPAAQEAMAYVQRTLREEMETERTDRQ
jgi:PhnB protein